MGLFVGEVTCLDNFNSPMDENHSFDSAATRLFTGEVSCETGAENGPLGGGDTGVAGVLVDPVKLRY